MSRIRLGSWFAGVLVAGGALACSDAPIGPKEPDLPASGRLGVTPRQDTIAVTDSAGTTVQLTPTINIFGSKIATPQNPGSVKWSSSDTAVAVVNYLGVVTARALGEVRITAEAGGQDAVATIAVVPATYRIVTAESAIAGFVGDTAQVVAAAILDDASPAPGVRFTYRSANTAVATVDSAGTVLLVGPGTTTITVGDTHATAPATVAVTVAPRPATGP